uniref:Uncharacterized protein n=1 Tax=Leptocylindrus danicus TaxID=163516 RepID=A0A7S2K6C2_9STRA|mmetsp:Transcript_17959/g.26731  ORF Transcript_17959/g.26731 Transcript_17959/m.26731 type:complete len:202 (+) Transcript_17959:145-750(+)|eukprot:CAMPEP_0116016524 /NCGR_PEP_ID=MMETSP0321-20121206/7534_1 /TAXON_ID=163516 /ORGANISM="Leptocylindrus danicus var. danicus, Strain B650" /LENGTH=201 /DNA_ID=CAMNT_0003486603 /DNA_START=68 /DNA_END=673 /DNA_ORIENTATION=+
MKAFFTTTLMMLCSSSTLAFAPNTFFTSTKTKTSTNLAALSKADQSAAIETFRTAYGGKRTKTGIDEKLLLKNLQLLAKEVGDDNAMIMVTKCPKVLEFNGSNFAPTFANYCTNFGDDVALATVLRNPALMSVAPTGYGGADGAGQETVVLSYVVDATRDGGQVWLSLLAFLLLTPLLEQVTGVHFREAILPNFFVDMKFI